MIKGNLNNKNLHIVDTCVRCNKDMYEGEKYYDINGQTFCRKCFLKEKLIKLWKTYDTKQLAHIFEKYMKNIGVRKYDRRRKNNDNTYLIEGKGTNWNRVQCFYHKGATTFGQDNLVLTLRKRAGSYFIIERELVRAFECDRSGIKEFDEKLLNEIMNEHKDLFDDLLSNIS